MTEYQFTDALTGHRIALTDVGTVSRVEAGECGCAESVFFPGCSLASLAPALTAVLADYLVGLGSVEGTSLLCCGKILDFEGAGGPRRAAVNEQLRTLVRAAGTRRIVAACPNCAAALRRALSGGEDAPEVTVVSLAAELAERGCRIGAEDVARVLAAKGAAVPGDVRLWVHDSCPDGREGSFAKAVRALLPEGSVANPWEGRPAGCCGSRARAAGRHDDALAEGGRRHDGARAAGATAVVASCMSCAMSLSLPEGSLPVVHYLELLCDYPIDWKTAARPLGVRFLPGEGGAEPAAAEKDVAAPTASAADERPAVGRRRFIALSRCRGAA